MINTLSWPVLKNNSIEDYSHFQKAKNTILAKGSLKVNVVSDSMSPFLAINDKIELCHFPYEKLRFPMVTAYLYETRITLHIFWRFSTKKNTMFYTRSLKAPNTDEGPHSSSNYLGVLANQTNVKLIYLYIKASLLKKLRRNG